MPAHRTERQPTDGLAERRGTVARQRLLDAAVDHVSVHGFTETSLRQLATAIGTSHRMLLYHFGSKEALQVAIIQAVEARTRAQATELVNGLVADGPPDTGQGDAPSPAAALRQVWQVLTSPENDGPERLFFELYGQALQGRAGTEHLLAGIVTDWTEPMTEIEKARGVPAREAAANVRLTLAVMRGLLLDLLATGDAAAVDDAFERYLEAFDPNR